MDTVDKMNRIQAELDTIIESLREAHGLDAVVVITTFTPKTDGDDGSVILKNEEGNSLLCRELIRYYADRNLGDKDIVDL
jgi:hypothetical protein